MNSKIALGTAQFGLDYGINNKRGKIPYTEVEEIVEIAYDNGIEMLDTAFSYGDSEHVIGSILEKHNLKFNIVSKLPSESLPNNSLFYFKESIERLRQKELYGYLLHDLKTFKKYPEIWEMFKDLKNLKRVKKIGFSLYYPSEIDYLFDNKIDFDIIQLPYSIFDQRFDPYFSELKKRDMEIHVRSVFLQGLIFKDPAELGSYFSDLEEKIIIVKKMVGRNNIYMSSICLNFVLLNKYIDKIVLGIDNLENLKENLNAIIDIDYVETLYKELKNLQIKNEDILLPFKWNKI